MGKPDALPQRADHGSGAGDNDNIVLLAPELFVVHALEGIALKGVEQTLLCEICQGTDKETMKKLLPRLLENSVSLPPSLSMPMNGLTLMVCSYSMERSMFPTFQISDNALWNSIMTPRLPDMLDTGKPSSWSHGITGGLRCQDILANMSPPAMLWTFRTIFLISILLVPLVVSYT
jgi:hypothetical protein